MREIRKESEVRCVLWLWSGSRESFWKTWIEYCSPERLSSLKCKLRTSLCFSRKSDRIEYLVRLRLFLLRHRNRNFWTIIKFSLKNLMRILWKHLPAGLQVRYSQRDAAFKSSLIFPSASILCTWAMFSFVLHYIFLEVPRISKLERS